MFVRVLARAGGAVLLVAGFAACGGSDSGGVPDSAREALQRAQHAVQGAGSYRVTVSGHNAVLPHWGGIDGGTVAVGTNGPLASATLDRTGDGQYTMLFVNNETLFRRSTCDHFSRVPGGA